jgi:hypothetical protein
MGGEAIIDLLHKCCHPLIFANLREFLKNLAKISVNSRIKLLAKDASWLLQEVWLKMEFPL